MMKVTAVDSRLFRQGAKPRMSLFCPVCRAGNDAGPSCRRCKADLSMLFTIEAQREAHLGAAREAIAQGRPVLASLEVRKADELRRGADAARLAAVAALLHRDFDQAWAQYRRASKLGG
jgi:hypothetical protein